MDDKTLLERAARAAGLKPDEAMWHPRAGFVWVKRVDGIRTENAWNPLHDDGDEARLEGALCFNVTWGMASVTVDMSTERYNDHNGDKQKARRYAGVRAAAAIGSAHEAQ